MASAAGTKPWLTPPRYEIRRVMTIHKADDPQRPLKFAELNLDGRIVRYAVSTPECRWRVETLFTKEPGTIDWLESFRPGEALVDVGANVGMYSVYAGAVCGARVYAFEPESQNYAELCRNIFLNGAHGAITAYCAALGERPVEVSRLLLNRFGAGLSFHDFSEPSRGYDPQSRLAQGCIAFSLDHLIETGAVPCPAHVKIDVDGHEQRVIRGMAQLLESKRIRTLLLECDASLPATSGIVAWLRQLGWQVNPDQLRLTREGLRPAAAVMDELGRGAFTGNVIFGRAAEDLAFASRALERFSASQLDAISLAS
jgi:FkbM family methyltransferase